MQELEKEEGESSAGKIKKQNISLRNKKFLVQCTWKF